MNNKEFENYRDKIEKRSDELTAEELESTRLYYRCY